MVRHGISWYTMGQTQKRHLRQESAWMPKIPQKNTDVNHAGIYAMVYHGSDTKCCTQNRTAWRQKIYNKMPMSIMLGSLPCYTTVYHGIPWVRHKMLQLGKKTDWRLKICKKNVCQSCWDPYHGIPWSTMGQTQNNTIGKKNCLETKKTIGIILGSIGSKNIIISPSGVLFKNAQ